MVCEVLEVIHLDQQPAYINALGAIVYRVFRCKSYMTELVEVS